MKETTTPKPQKPSLYCVWRKFPSNRPSRSVGHVSAGHGIDTVGDNASPGKESACVVLIAKHKGLSGDLHSVCIQPVRFSSGFEERFSRMV